MSVTILNPERFADRPVAVLFDLDNTLYPYIPAHAAGMAAVKLRAAEGLGTGPEEFEDAIEKARAEIKTRLGPTASSHSRLLYFQRTLEHLGLRSQVQLSLDFEQTYWDSYLSIAKLRDGVTSFLDQLGRAGIPKVIVTDLTAQIQFQKLVHLGIDGQFEYVVTSEESGADKPDSTGFEIAMDKLSLPSDRGELVWMIGDNLTADIEGARDAIGATTIGLREEIGDYEGNRSIDMVFDSFVELQQFFPGQGWDTPVN